MKTDLIHSLTGTFDAHAQQTENGREFVVEYKGAHLAGGQQEKRTIGELWERRSSGCCLFVMPQSRDFNSIPTKIQPYGR